MLAVIGHSIYIIVVASAHEFSCVHNNKRLTTVDSPNLKYKLYFNDVSSQLAIREDPDFELVTWQR